MIFSKNEVVNTAMFVYNQKFWQNIIKLTMGIFERNEYIPHGNELVPYEITFMRIGNEFIPTLCWNLHKPKPPKIKTFLMEKGF